MNKTILALSAIALGTGVLFTSASNALAYRGDPNVQGPNYTAERHEAMSQAFDSNNYGAWKELMQDKGKVTQVINEGNFNRFTEMHKLLLEGKTEDAGKIREELGLGLRDCSGKELRPEYGRNTNR